MTERGEGERTQSKIKPEMQAEPEQAEPICYPRPILRQNIVAKNTRSRAGLLGSESLLCHDRLITPPLGPSFLTNPMRKIMKLV